MASGVPPVQEPPDRRARILDAAALAFRERGFHGVGMDELGARAGLTGPSLYRHFSGKAEILASLLNHAMDELTAATVAVGEDPLADLERALRHHLRFAQDRRDLVVLHQREVGNLVDPWAPAFSRRMGQYTRNWERLFGRCLPDLDADAVAAITQAGLGTVFSVSSWPTRARRAADTDGVEELVLGLLHRGLAGLSGRGSPTSTPRSAGTAARPTPR